MEEQKRKTRLTTPILVTVLLGAVLLIVFQISSAVQGDPLYTDLKASPLYAKNGFLPSYAHITDPDSLDWDLALPPHGGQIVMSDLPEPEGSARYGRFSIADRKIEEFTIFIPFTLEQNSYKALWGNLSSHPVLFFAGIGENWEIYLNGYSVTKQIFLDEAGNISKFRSEYNISIPVSKEYLNEGDNYLVIHIYGARSSKWTGLRYTSPYYLGDSSYVTHDFMGTSSIVMSTIFMFAGLYHLLIYAYRKTDRYNLMFAGFIISASLYYFTKISFTYFMISNTEHIQRLNYALMYLTVFMGAAFLETISRKKISKVTAAYGCFGAALAASQWFFPIWFAYALLNVWQIVSAVFVGACFIAYGIVWQIYKGAMKLSKEPGSQPGLWQGVYRYLFKTEFGIVYIVLMIVGLTAIIDIITNTVYRADFPLSQYSQLGFVLCMTYVLTRKYSGQYEAPAFENTASQEQNLAAAGLTQEEMIIAKLMIKGATNYEIAGNLHIHVVEVRQYEKIIRNKLGFTGEFDPLISDIAMKYDLTKREIEMLKHLRESVPTEQIAADLFITEGTVRSHVSSLLTKLDIESRQDVAAWLEKYRTVKQ